MKLQFQEYNISEQHIYQIKYVYEELKKMSLDKLWYDISVDDECVFFYGKKKDVKFFFNIFYDENENEALVNVSTIDKKYTIENKVEISLNKLKKIIK